MSDSPKKGSVLVAPPKDSSLAITPPIDNKRWWANFLYLLSFVIGFAGFALASEVGIYLSVFFAPLVIFSLYRLASEFKDEDTLHRYSRKIATLFTFIASGLLTILYAQFLKRPDVTPLSFLFNIVTPASLILSLTIEFIPAIVDAWQNKWRNKWGFYISILAALAIVTIALVPNLAAYLLSAAKLSDTFAPVSFLGAVIFFAISITLKNTQEDLTEKRKRIPPKEEQVQPAEQPENFEQILTRLDAVATNEPLPFHFPIETQNFFDTLDIESEQKSLSLPSSTAIMSQGELTYTLSQMQMNQMNMVAPLTSSGATALIKNIESCQSEVYKKISAEAQSSYNEEARIANELREKANHILQVKRESLLGEQKRISQEIDAKTASGIKSITDAAQSELIQWQTKYSEARTSLRNAMASTNNASTSAALTKTMSTLEKEGRELEAKREQDIKAATENGERRRREALTELQSRRELITQNEAVIEQKHHAALERAYNKKQRTIAYVDNLVSDITSNARRKAERVIQAADEEKKRTEREAQNEAKRRLEATDEPRLIERAKKYIKMAFQARGEALQKATEILRQDRLADAQALVPSFLQKLVEAEAKIAVANELLNRIGQLNPNYKSSYADDLANLDAANPSSALLLQSMEQYLRVKETHHNAEITNAQRRRENATTTCNEKIHQAALAKEAAKERIRQNLEQTKHREYQEEKTSAVKFLSGSMLTQALEDAAQNEENYFNHQFNKDVDSAIQSAGLDAIEARSVTAAREELAKKQAEEGVIIQRNRELLEAKDASTPDIATIYARLKQEENEQVSKKADDTSPLPEIQHPDLTTNVQHCISVMPDYNEQKSVPANAAEITASKAILAWVVAYDALQVDRHTIGRVSDKDSRELFSRKSPIEVFRQTHASNLFGFTVVQPEQSAVLLSALSFTSDNSSSSTFSSSSAANASSTSSGPTF